MVEHLPSLEPFRPMAPLQMEGQTKQSPSIFRQNPNQKEPNIGNREMPGELNSPSLSWIDQPTVLRLVAQNQLSSEHVIEEHLGLGNLEFVTNTKFRPFGQVIFETDAVGQVVKPHDVTSTEVQQPATFNS